MSKAVVNPNLICPICYKRWDQCESMRVAVSTSVSDPPLDGMSRSVILAARHYDVCLICRMAEHQAANEMAKNPGCLEKRQPKGSHLPAWWNPKDYDTWLAIRRGKGAAS